MELAGQRRAGFEPADLPPVIVCERTPDGWHGLTEDGELLQVKGKSVPLGGSISIVRNGETHGFRRLPSATTDGAIDHYLTHFTDAVKLMRNNENEAALAAIDHAIEFASTLRARYNRALILLALGRWIEGFGEYHKCENVWPFQRPMSRIMVDYGIKRWTGEDIAGKRLLLTHDHGHGDSIMMLRYVRPLIHAGAHVTLMMPPELARLASQLAPVLGAGEMPDADYFCTMFGLGYVLHLRPGNIPTVPYLKVDPELVEKWRQRIGRGRGRKRIGLAWSVGKMSDGDYARAVPLGVLTKALGRDADLISVQQQGCAEADMLGVEHYQFEDFADCAALVALLDEVLTIDTAALHLAGAIGHRKITALLPYWSSWRWLAPLYRNITFCKQDAPGDWESALAKRPA